jgi:hypothetical protein
MTSFILFKHARHLKSFSPRAHADGTRKFGICLSLLFYFIRLVPYDKTKMVGSPRTLTAVSTLLHNINFYSRFWVSNILDNILCTFLPSYRTVPNVKIIQKRSAARTPSVVP